MDVKQLSLFINEIPDRDLSVLTKKKKKSVKKTVTNIESETEIILPLSPKKEIFFYLETPENLRIISDSTSIRLKDEDIAIKDIHERMQTDSSFNENQNNFLQEVKEVALACHKCRLAENRTKVVFSDGDPNAPIMLIGEGPGENEDLSGLPFVGKAGKLLDKILASAGIERKTDLYLANVVKCRPPENRDPFPEEKDACSVYLEKQLELTKSSIILLAGSVALKTVLGSEMSITKERGKWIEWKGKWVMPVFHPSYLLRNHSREVGSPKWLMWQDIRKVKQKLAELTRK